MPDRIPKMFLNSLPQFLHDRGSPSQNFNKLWFEYSITSFEEEEMEYLGFTNNQEVRDNFDLDVCEIDLSHVFQPLVNLETE